MRNIGITFIFLLLIGGLVAFAVWGYNKRPAGDEKLVVSLYDIAMSHDLDNDYPTLAADVITVMNDINMYLYSVGADPDLVPNIVLQQRKLLSTQLLEQNPEEYHITVTRQEVNSFISSGVKILSATLSAPEYYEDSLTLCLVKATMITNQASSGGNIILTYYLAKDDDGRWKIMGWE